MGVGPGHLVVPACLSVRYADHLSRGIVFLLCCKGTFRFAFFGLVGGDQIVVDLLLRAICTFLCTVLQVDSNLLSDHVHAIGFPLVPCVLWVRDDVIVAALIIVSGPNLTAL